MTPTERTLELIQAEMPDASPDEITWITEGPIYDVALVAGRRVFRFPKEDSARAALDREMRVLALVREHVELPVPAFQPHAAGYVSYDLIPGEPLFRDDILRMEGALRDGVLQQLATFLAQLHTIPPETLEAAAIPPAPLRDTHEAWMAFYEDVQRELGPLMLSTTREWARRLFVTLKVSPAFLDHTPCLIHGDLAQYHILFDRSNRALAGILDFGTAGLGDPAVDIGLLLNLYGETVLRVLARWYPGVGRLIDRARFYAGALELQWTLNGVRSGDASWFTVHLDRARDTWPIGSG